MEWENKSEGDKVIYSVFDLIEFSDQTKIIWSVDELVETDSLIGTTISNISPAAREEFVKLERAYYGYWINRIGCKFGGFNANLQTYFDKKCFSCTECQDQTYDILTSLSFAVKYWSIVRIEIPAHNAVAVYPKDKSVRDGYIFDPWPTQSPMVYSFDRWPFSWTKRLVREE